MLPDEEEKALMDFLAERRKKPAPDPEFTKRVMISVRAQAVVQEERRTIPSRPPTRRPFWPFLTAWDPRGLSGMWNPPRAAMAMASLLLLAGASLYVTGHRVPGPGRTDVTRIKGDGFQLGFLLKRGAVIAPAVSGEVYFPGDKLQAVYSAEAPGHLHLFSLDERGGILCFSCQGGDPELPAGQGKTLPFALELDGSILAEAMVGFWIPSREAARHASADSIRSMLSDAWKLAHHDFTVLQGLLAAETAGGKRTAVFQIKKRGKI